MFKRQNFQLSTQTNKGEPVPISQIEDDDDEESSQKDSPPKQIVKLNGDAKRDDNIKFNDLLLFNELKQNNDEFMHQQFQFNHDEQQIDMDEEFDEPPVRKVAQRQRPQQQRRRPQKKDDQIIQFSQSHSQQTQIVVKKLSPPRQDSEKIDRENSSNANVEQTGQHSNLLKQILGIRMKQGRTQYLIEKNSSNRAWKESTLLSTKGYAEELMLYNKFLNDRVYSSLYNQYILGDDVETFYIRRLFIQKGILMREKIFHFRGRGYSKQWEVFDHKIKKKLKRTRYSEPENQTQILEYHTLPLNKKLVKTMYIESCEKKNDEVVCTFWHDGKQQIKRIQDIQDQFPKEIAIYLFDRMKQKI